jgi:hypothetical protein
MAKNAICCVRDLIREDEKRAAQEKLEALLVEGIQSNLPSEMIRQGLGGHSP